MSASPESLLTELAGSVTLRTICIPPPVRRDHPELEAAATALALATTPNPVGHEEILCVAGRSHEDTAETGLMRFTQPPFLILISDKRHPQWAIAEAGRLLTQSTGWLASSGPGEDDALLLAPVSRFLEATQLPGSWRAAPAIPEALESERETLDALWRATGRDRESLAALSAHIIAVREDLAHANSARERLNVEVTRLRNAERHELDRLRLIVAEERAWVATQATRLGRSTSWRIGHRLVRLGRLLAFRRDRGTDLPTMIAKRMEKELQ